MISSVDLSHLLRKKRKEKAVSVSGGEEGRDGLREKAVGRDEIRARLAEKGLLRNPEDIIEYRS